MLDASGIIHVDGDRFLVAEDEIDILRYFVLDKEGLTFKVAGTIDFGKDESDFESLAFDPRTQRYYCIGSHGEDYSQRLLGFELVDKEVRNKTEIDFDARHLIKEDVDIEGLSVWGHHLLIAYRKPSRDRLALVLLLDVESGAQLLTSFNLAGRTFRDIVRMDDKNYLILAGPEHGKDYETLPSCIFWWNGDIFSPQLIQCNVDLHDFRAEGIALRLCDDESIDVLIGSDESKIKGAVCFRMMFLNSADISGLINGVNKPVELQVEI